jgi:hypothetical protein
MAQMKPVEAVGKAGQLCPMCGSKEVVWGIQGYGCTVCPYNRTDKEKGVDKQWMRPLERY